MPQYEIKDGPISVAYGYDNCLENICEVFMYVVDSRLEWDENSSEEVNSAAESLLYSKDGGGCYFSLTTSPIGIGLKVNKHTMGVYLKRYGVPEDHIRSIFKREPIVEKSKTLKSTETSIQDNLLLDELERLDLNTKNSDGNSNYFCIFCKVNIGSKKCSRCKVACYCDKNCQINDWPVHKFFCGSLPFPKPAARKSGKTVRAVYLPELSGDPVLINLPIINDFIEDGYEEVWFERPELENYLGEGIYGRNWMPLNPLKKTRKIADTIEFKYRENFLHDGSKLNQCVQKITQNRSFYDWKGPIIVTRYRGKGAEGDYLDLEEHDFLDIIDYLLWYGINNEYFKKLSK
jgi:hypothetical protein